MCGRITLSTCFKSHLTCSCIDQSRLYDRPQVFILGVGAAYASIVQMIKTCGMWSVMSVYELITSLTQTRSSARATRRRRQDLFVHL